MSEQNLAAVGINAEGQQAENEPANTGVENNSATESNSWENWWNQTWTDEWESDWWNPNWAEPKKETPKGIQKILAERNALKKQAENSIPADKVNEIVDQRLAERQAEAQLTEERNRFVEKFWEDMAKKVEEKLVKHPTLDYNEAYALIPETEKFEVNRNTQGAKSFWQTPSNIRTWNWGEKPSVDVLRERAMINLKQRGFW